MTTTNYRGYKIELYSKMRMHPTLPVSQKIYVAWVNGKSEKKFNGTTRTEAITKAKAWIDAQEGTE